MRDPVSRGIDLSRRDLWMRDNKIRGFSKKPMRRFPNHLEISQHAILNESICQKIDRGLARGIALNCSRAARMCSR